jgi:hypothetical protein
MPKSKPTMNHLRVLQWIAYHQRRGTEYAPVGASYKRAQDLVDFGFVKPTHGHSASGMQHYSATQAGLELLAILDRHEKGTKSYWLQDSRPLRLKALPAGAAKVKT